MHFDHCRAAAYLEAAFPDMAVAASAKAGDILARPNALALMARLNQAVTEVVRGWNPSLPGEEDFAPFFGLDMTLAEGQELDLGKEV